jgi:hypothetical protein
MKSAAAFTACAAIFAAGDASAGGRYRIDIGRLDFEGLAIEDLSVDWSRDAERRDSVGVKAGRVRGLAATGPLSRFSIDCPSLEISGDELRCEGGRLSGALGALGVQDTRFTARRQPDGSLRLRFDSFAVADGRGRLDLSVSGQRWSLQSRLASLDVAELVRIAKPWYALPADFTAAGETGGTVVVSGSGERIEKARADLDIARLDYADATGALAGERLAGKLTLDAAASGEGRFAIRSRVALDGGQTYSDPVFLDFAAHHATLELAGAFDADAGRLEAESFSLDHSEVLQASGSATLDFGGAVLMPEARIRIAALDVENALPTYAQPYLIDSPLKDLAGTGTIRGEVDFGNGEFGAGSPVRAALEFDEVNVGSSTASVSLRGIDGRFNWYDDAVRSALAGRIDDSLFQSRIGWKSGRLWGLALGSADLPFAAVGRHFRLTAPAVLPIFDGGLAISTLRVRHAGMPEMYVRFDATLKPVGVAHLSRAFGWPEFQGTLAGRIPGLQLRQGVVTLDGNLEANVFDGHVTVRNLRLSDPLGKFPRLFASVDVENVDLALVTRTFEFGMITGRLSGYITNLETFGWLPESFDAFLYTPATDRSRHRISQRAVSNLSSIGGGSGGGVAAAFQGGFLRFFDDFGYDRVGLSCRLANDVCLMGGVAPADIGYYIVKGKGLPRIDVIGSQSRVAWTTLVRQLATATISDFVVE